MAKIARKSQKQFGGTAGPTDLGEFGSFAAGSPTYSSDPAVIQGLANFLTGWKGAIVGGNSPCLEDDNSLNFLWAYQLGYLLQEGIPEWDSGTTYYTGSIAQDGTGIVYVSLADSNTNHALSSATWWKLLKTPVVTTYTQDSTWTAPAGVTNVRVYTVPQDTKKLVLRGNSAFMTDMYRNVWGWGTNTNGLLGINSSTAAFSSPVQVVGGLQFTEVECLPGLPTSLMLDIGGNLFTVGISSNGSLGNGSASGQVSSPVAVLGQLKFSRLASYGGSQTNGDVCAMALDASGNAWAWGLNIFGAIGNGTNNNYSSPVQVVGGLKFTSLAVSNEFGGAIFCSGLDTSGNAWSWGSNSAGQAGNAVNATNMYSSPVQVVGGIVFQKLFINANFLTSVFGLDTSNQLWAWGDNASGNLGNNTNQSSVISVSSPVLVVGGIKFSDNIVFPLAGAGSGSGSAVIALDTSGNAWAWGVNTNGQLGLGDNVDRSSPVQVVGGIKFQKLSAKSQVMGLDVNHNLYSWGLNTNGQLGVGDRTPRSSPVQVVGSLKFSQFMNIDIASGGGVIAADQNGVVWSWGNNATGALGTGGVVATSSPVKVLGAMTFNPFNPQQGQSFLVTVVPGTTYQITVQAAYAQFGPQVLNTFAKQIVVEYQQ